MKRVGWFLMLILPLAACGPSQSPDEVVAEYWRYTLSLEPEEASQLLTAEMRAKPSQMEGQERLIVEAMFAKTSFETREPEIDGDTAVVMVAVSAPDLLAIVSSITTEQLTGMFLEAFGDMSEEQMEQLVVQLMIRELDSDSVPISRNLVEHQLVIEDGEWKISAIDEQAFRQVLGMPGNAV